MSSSIASTSSANCKASKNPGLALNLTNEARGTLLPKNVVVHRRSSSTSSLSNTPELESDWNSEDDMSDCGDDDDAQYVYIPADSPFYRGPTSPRTSSYLSFSGFPFACDALAEEDPLFAHSPGALFDKEPEPEFTNAAPVIFVDVDLAEDMDMKSDRQWNLMEFRGSLKHAKQAQTPVETSDDSAFRQYF
ncbi:hypothetical protein D9615_009163 [Tricholomella constricta]|uniref:Uncharacterized protein n=1 Tax=Tricholomella constricta TaxID=117010 RepID=A0A8H5H2R8_9AGAR|nr:hypothetical protein D9615_009163 [Tricholomella constricta]